MTTNHPKSDNAFGNEPRDDAKSAEFASILREQDDIRTQMMALRERETALQKRLLTLAGFEQGQTVELQPGVLGVLNRVEAEPFIVPRSDRNFLRITGECSPLTKAGVPSQRERHTRFRHVLWHVDAPLLKRSTT